MIENVPEDARDRVYIDAEPEEVVAMRRMRAVVSIKKDRLNLFVK